MIACGTQQKYSLESRLAAVEYGSLLTGVPNRKVYQRVLLPNFTGT